MKKLNLHLALHSTHNQQSFVVILPSMEQIITSIKQEYEAKDAIITAKDKLIDLLFNNFVGNCIIRESLINWYEFASSYGKVQSITVSNGGVSYRTIYVDAALQGEEDIPVTFSLHIETGNIYHNWISSDFTMKFKLSNIVDLSKINYSKLIEVFVAKRTIHIDQKLNNANSNTYSLDGATANII